MKNNYFDIILIFLIFLLIYLINIFLKKKIIKESFIGIDKKKSIEIIIARYNENLNWTLEYPFNQYQYTVYNKGNNKNFEKSRIEKIIDLNNFGKCDHTYLKHIINNYNNLKDITVFLPGSIDLKYKKEKAIKLLNYIEKYDSAIFLSKSKENIKNKYYNFFLDNWITSSKANRDIINLNNKKLKKSSIRPFGKWFENKFGNINVNCHTQWGIFSIDKKDIIQNDISWYKNLISELDDHINPEVGHFIERGWCAIFYPLNYTMILRN
jgi:hypothetical protein